MTTTAAPSEDPRRLFQARLALLYRVGFAISAAFLCGAALHGLLTTGVVAELRSPSRAFHLLATVVTLVLWASLARHRFSAAMLGAIDVGGMLLLLLLLNLNAGLVELRTVCVFNLVLTTGVPLVLRSVLLPSSVPRTVAIGSIGIGITLSIFFLSAVHPSWPIRQLGEPSWPMPLQLLSLGLWLAAFLGVAILASRILYDLRSEVRAARQFGQYVLGDKLGEGGMGVVYLATHAMLRREAALKLLLPERVDAMTLDRFAREVRQTARLRHPNTVAVFDYGRTPEGQFYYAMEYLDGLTIEQLVSRVGPLPPGRVVWLLHQVCASLDEAHTMGLVHRDIKPQNIMVVGHTGAFDLVKVLDFGLVKDIRERSEDNDGSDEPTSGTPLYMAPEAISNPDKVDARTDLYAVAAVAYFMLAGTPVFRGSTIAETCAEHLYSTPVPPSQRLGRALPPDLEALILKGLAKAPSDRPATAASFRDALLACDVSAWTQEDARSWWRTEGARIRRPLRMPTDLSHAPTVSVVLERRE